MTKMLRITRCIDPSMWYANMVGQLVPLEWEWPEGWASREPAGYINLVHFDDAEVEEVEPAERRACNACGWAGQQSETVMLGGIGPLCPMCRETTDAQGAEARGQAMCGEKSADYIPIPDPDQSDLDTACKVMKLLANMSYGYYPSNEQGAPTFFDGDNVEHLRALHRLLFDIAKNCHGATRVMCADGIFMTKSKDLVRPVQSPEAGEKK